MKRLGLVLGLLLAGSTAAANAADSALSPQANAAYIANYAKKAGVYKRQSGLEYRILQNGFGARPAATDIVTVYYKGALSTERSSTRPSRASRPISRSTR